ncbi:MAG: hypothetical protein ABSG83_21230 [Roseiarcus sp.]|jgi:hypothetical protein
MIKIEINCDPEALDAHVRALGFARMTGPVVAPAPTTNGHTDGKPEVVVPPGSSTWKVVVGDDYTTAPDITVSLDAAGDGYRTAPEIKVIYPNGDPVMTATATPPSSMTTAFPTAETPAASPAAVRVPGQPSPGRKRRTREEVEADEAYFAAVKAAAQEQESTAGPEPDAPPVDPAVVAQDEADEAAETAARQDGPLTLEDVRAAVAVWTTKVGTATAVAQLRTLLGCSLIELKPEDYAAAIAKLLGADLPVAAPRTGTKEAVIAAIKAYGRKYDGSDDPEKMALTKIDLPKVFQSTFGDPVTGLGSMPQNAEAFGRIIAAIEAATKSNLFGREVREAKP